MRHKAALAGESPAAARSGFTLVEMMVAVMILSIGLLGLAGTAAVVTRQVGGGANQNAAAQVVQSRYEMFRSTPCNNITQNKATTRGVYEHWVPGATVNRVRVIVDTVKYSVGGSAKTEIYTMAVPCPQ
jgi:prepilin-type N-terminal cleavage/methylation domain-containing protein